VEWVEGVGSSIAEATEMALEALGVHEDDAEVEVVNDVKVGLFNRVKDKARVRVRVKPAVPRSKDDKRRRRGRSGGGQARIQGGPGSKQGQKAGQKSKKSGSQTSGRGGGQKPSKRGPEARSAGESAGQKGGRDGNRKRNGGQKAASKPEDENMESMTLSEQADLAEAFVTGLAAEFGETVTFERVDVDESEIRVIVSGENLGRMIGRRGTTANSIDELVRTVLQRRAGSGRDGRIRVDIGGVAGRREEALRAFCKKVAAQVRETGKEVALEPMRGSDRKIVHDAMTEEDGVDTTSEGEDPNRRVVVVPAGNDD